MQKYEANVNNSNNNNNDDDNNDNNNNYNSSSNNNSLYLYDEGGCTVDEVVCYTTLLQYNLKIPNLTV